MSKKKQFAQQVLLTTANKNIYSSFMRSDISYFCKEEETWPAYKNEEDLVQVMEVLDENVKIWQVEENDKNLNQSENLPANELELGLKLPKVEEKNTKTEATKTEETTVTIPGLFNFTNLSREVTTSKLFYDNILPSMRNTFTCLLFRDTLTRSELLFFVYLFLNKKQAKGILLLPESLSIAISMNIHSAIIVHQTDKFIYCSIIEDFVLVNTKILYLNEEDIENQQSDTCDEFYKQNVLFCNKKTGEDSTQRKYSENNEKLIETEKGCYENPMTDIFTLFKSELDFVDEFELLTSNSSYILCDLCFEWVDEAESVNHVIKMHFKSNKCECLRRKETNKKKLSENIVEGVKKRRRRRTKQEMLESKNAEIAKKLEMIGPDGVKKRKKRSDRKSLESTASQSCESAKSSNLNSLSVSEQGTPSHSQSVESKSVSEKSQDKSPSTKSIDTKSQEDSQKSQEDSKSESTRSTETVPGKGPNENEQTEEKSKLKLESNTAHASTHVKNVFTGESLTDKLEHFLNLYVKKENLKDNIVICSENLIDKLAERNKEINFIDINKADVRKGAASLLNIELSKDLWMTDKEWNASQLRVLKEKLLFHF